MTRAAVSASPCTPSRPRTAAPTRGSAASSGTPSPQPSDIPQVADRAGAHAIEGLGRGDDGLPFRDGLAGQEIVQGGDQRGRVLAGGHPGPVLGRDPDELLVFRPVAMMGRVDRGDRETPLGGEAARAGRDAGGFLVLPAAVSHEDQGTSAGRVVRRPQHAGNLAESEQLFGDAVRRRLTDESHSV